MRRRNRLILEPETCPKCGSDETRRILSDACESYCTACGETFKLDPDASVKTRLAGR